MYARIFIYCNTVAQILVFLSSCCNPVIYGIFNQNYSQCLPAFQYNLSRFYRAMHYSA